MNTVKITCSVVSARFQLLSEFWTLTAIKLLFLVGTLVSVGVLCLQDSGNWGLFLPFLRKENVQWFWRVLDQILEKLQRGFLDVSWTFSAQFKISSQCVSLRGFSAIKMHWFVREVIHKWFEIWNWHHWWLCWSHGSIYLICSEAQWLQ